MKKRVIIIFISVCLVFSIGLSILFTFFYRYKGKENNFTWSYEDEFSISSIKTIEKEKGKDFIILNLADIQMCDTENFFNASTIHKEITEIVKSVKPNLITLTGDQTWSNENLISLKRIIRWLDSYKIPYAPVFGNHDYGNEEDTAVASQNYCSDLYEKGKYCLYSKGPNNLGSLGNYVINIMEDGKIYRTLYMINNGYEDEISENQLDFIKWNAEGIKAVNFGEYSDGMIFMHKPIDEYRYAYHNYCYNLDSVEKVSDEVYAYSSLYGIYGSELFDLAKEINVLDFVCGHQHNNSFTLKYEGINLTFALKTGENSFFYEDEDIYLNGATYFVLGENESVKNFYVERGKYTLN